MKKQASNAQRDGRKEIHDAELEAETEERNADATIKGIEAATPKKTKPETDDTGKK